MNENNTGTDLNESSAKPAVDAGNKPVFYKDADNHFLTDVSEGAVKFAKEAYGWSEEHVKGFIDTLAHHKATAATIESKTE